MVRRPASPASEVIFNRSKTEGEERVLISTARSFGVNAEGMFSELRERLGKDSPEYEARLKKLASFDQGMVARFIGSACRTGQRPTLTQPRVLDFIGSIGPNPAAAYLLAMHGKREDGSSHAKNIEILSSEMVTTPKIIARVRGMTFKDALEFFQLMLKVPELRTDKK